MAKTIIPIDPAVYSRAPNMTVSSGIALAHSLVEACPKDADPKVKKSCKQLKKVADGALEDFTARNKQLGVFSEEDSRVVDNEADRCWSALRMRLQAMALIHEYTGNAKRAAEMDWTLFQGSLEFVKEEYPSQSTRMASILKQIDDDKLQPAIDELCGVEFLAACRAVQPRYEQMVSERLRRDASSGVNLAETLRKLGAAIVSYASKVVGSVDDDDADSHEQARQMLRPILVHREGQTRAAPQPAAPGPNPDISIPLKLE